jgi:hypothetical protein
MAHGVPTRLTSYTPSEGRRFGLTVGGAFLALALFFAWRTNTTAATVLALIGGTLAVGGLLIPSRLGPVHRGWMSLALLISKVTTPLVMGAIYWLVLTPTGVLRRTFGEDPLTRPPESDSYWRQHSAKVSGPRSMERPF